MKGSRKSEMTVKEIYTKRFDEVLVNWEHRLQNDLVKCLESAKNIERVVVRAKSIERFVQKAEKIENGKRKYSDPLSQIQDQIGARIVVLYLDDVDVISKIVGSYFVGIEEKSIVPDSEKEFGYFGKHFILKIPTEVHQNEFGPKFFELQVKTLFQHSWGEAEHDLMYKGQVELTKDQRRRVAFTAAQAWGADLIFNELNKELKVKGNEI